VGHGTFYLHFADKRACFLAFADEAAAEIDEIVKAKVAGATSVAQMVDAVLGGVEEYAKTNPGVIKAALVDADIIDRSTIRISPHLVDLWAKRWVELLSGLRDRRSIAADLNLEVVGYALVGLLHQSTTAHERGHYSRDELLRTVVPFIERALEPRKK
jgi:AcrR family transcriptional regulator